MKRKEKKQRTKVTRIKKARVEMRQTYDGEKEMEERNTERDEQIGKREKG